MKQLLLFMGFISGLLSFWSGMNYYGLKDNKNNVTVFCLYGADSDEALAKSVDRVSKFLGTENLFLVDWIHRKIVTDNFYLLSLIYIFNHTSNPLSPTHTSGHHSIFFIQSLHVI